MSRNDILTHYLKGLTCTGTDLRTRDGRVGNFVGKGKTSEMKQSTTVKIRRPKSPVVRILSKNW